MAITERVLDTSAYSLFRKGSPQALKYIRETDKIWVPAIVMGELFGGFAGGTRKQQNLDEFDDFLSSSRVEIANVTSRTAERYAAIFQWLRSQGTPIPTNDIWIAAVAMEKGADLLSADGHFEQVPQIQLLRINA